MTVPVLQRLLLTLLTLWLAATLSFFALRVLPGDVVITQLTGSGASQETIRERQFSLGLHEPLPTQYVRFITNLARGDLGFSLIDGLPVSEVIAQRLMPTFSLATGSLVVATTVGVTLGIIGAVSVKSGVSSIARTVTSLALAMPIYWTGTMSILIFGFLTNSDNSMSEWLLPVGILGFHTSGTIARIIQTNLRETIQADFVRTAYAKGLPDVVVLYRHVLRPALPPAVAVIALQAGFLLGGTVITETLFLRPGLGQLLLSRTMQQDYPVVQGIVILSALVYTLLNTLAAILYRLIDPRVSH